MNNIVKKTADTLTTALRGQIGYNIWIEKHIHSKRAMKKIQQVREAHLKYIITASTAAGFIEQLGKQEEYDAFCDEVIKEQALSVMIDHPTTP